MRAIDADVLFERACNLEAQALAYVGKIVNDESKIEEWKIWSAILAERTAFKHDIFDAPEVKPESKKGKWITDKYGNVLCSECNWCAPQTMTGCLANRHLDYEKSAFCWHCGADMREDGEANEAD